MLYPVYVHRNRDTAYCAIVPDFEGCFAAAESLKELPAAVQEAAEALFEGEDAGAPEPSDPEKLNGEEFQGGTWAFIDIDTGKLNTAKERVNISVPVFALREIDEHIVRLGENRSHFLYTTALKVIRGEISEVIAKKAKAKRPARHKAAFEKASAKKKAQAKGKAATKKQTPTRKRTAVV